MAGARYTRYLGELDLEELLQNLMGALEDFFLFSGFPLSRWRRSDQTLADLHDAILDALLQGGVLDEATLERLLRRYPGTTAEQLEQLVQEIMERLQSEGYITTVPERPSALHPEGLPDPDSPREPDRVRFELTDKSLDFLGYKNLRDLLHATGRSGFGAHETVFLAPNQEAYTEPKPYEFGDTLQLDVVQTLLHAIQRQGPRLPLDIDYGDLHVLQGEYQSSCATVLMLDCSHSMILYGEDRFTPAKKVALALAHLIRTQFPGDSLHCVLFHDGAEEIQLRDLAKARVGPFYTNTCEGLRLARRILLNQRKEMRQVIMITDGKPSAVTLPSGHVYKNPYGLDPMIVEETLKEVVRCRRAGIVIHTFMLTDDPLLVRFVQKVTQLARGKAYFTTPMNLGRYVLMDFVNRKVRHIH